MAESEIIENKVANSGLQTISLGDFYLEGERVLFDIKGLLYQEMILREKDFREFVKSHDWSKYEGKFIALTCSADAIVPAWAYMILVSKLSPYASYVHVGSMSGLEVALFNKEIHNKLQPGEFQGAKVVIKGCGDIEVPVGAFAEITRLLTPYVASIMYGEPCSTVPVYKMKKK